MSILDILTDSTKNTVKYQHIHVRTDTCQQSNTESVVCIPKSKNKKLFFINVRFRTDFCYRFSTAEKKENFTKFQLSSNQLNFY